jgi:D-erythro-7,8-dihydroneopterin triphosphate epimerase
MKIRITNLRLRSIIGINDWERTSKQDVIINVMIEFDGSKAAATDNIDDTLNYKTICKKIIDLVENNKFDLIEKMIDDIANIALADNRAQEATVRVEKPAALRFADSVSVELSKTQGQ